MDISKWPRPSEEELPDMYDDINKMTKRAEELLREHFTITEHNGEERVQFRDAGAETFLEFLDADHKVSVAVAQKITGLPDREFERQYGITGIGQRLRNRKTTFHGVDDAEKFAEVLDELIPDSLSLETLLYTFYKSWEGDQRRFYRMRYEDDIRQFLTENGYPTFKGNALAGEPDFVIPDTEPYEVIGEVRVIQKTDKEKRFKEFRSEATEAKDSFGEVKFVAVANLGKQYLEIRDREDVRAEITKNDTSDIDVVVFHDERDEFIEKLENWGVSKQEKIG
jgi:hypothetical protein